MFCIVFRFHFTIFISFKLELKYWQIYKQTEHSYKNNNNWLCKSSDHSGKYFHLQLCLFILPSNMDEVDWMMIANCKRNDLDIEISQHTSHKCSEQVKQKGETHISHIVFMKLSASSYVLLLTEIESAVWVVGDYYM